MEKMTNAALDAKALQPTHLHDVRGHVTLPQAGKYGSTIAWRSENEEIITRTGEVTRPVNGSGDRMVTLTATISDHQQSITKEFQAHVKESPEREEFGAYLFSYFTGEGYENGEQIYFALSEGDNPLAWQEMNEGKMVITSELGAKGLRDPFIIRSPEGDKFYLIATDLKIHGNGDWEAVQSSGSRSIMVWESTNLIDWSEQRKVEIAPPEAGNAWAPEAYYDQETEHFVVFWASKIYENDEQRRKGASHQRMLYVKTRDFYTFTEPKTYFDYGYSIIDTTMIQHEGKIYRFTKDERDCTDQTPNGKFIFQEVGDSVLDKNFQSIREGIGRGQVNHGEGPIIFKANHEEKWYMFIDEFGDRGYVPFVTTDLDSGEWEIPENYQMPPRSRHGSVLPITKTEYRALQQAVPKVIAP